MRRFVEDVATACLLALLASALGGCAVLGLVFCFAPERAAQAGHLAALALGPILFCVAVVALSGQTKTRSRKGAR